MTQIPVDSWAFSEASPLAIRSIVSKLSAEQLAGFNPDSFAQMLYNDPRTHSMTRDQLSAAFEHVVKERTTVLQALPELGENVRSLDFARKVKAQTNPIASIKVDDILKAHEVTGKHLPGVSGQTIKAPGIPQGVAAEAASFTGKWKSLQTADKVGVAMSAGIGALCAMGAVSQLSHSMATDDQGQTKIQWSNVSMGIFNAVFAGLSLYLAHSQLSNQAQFIR